MMCDVCVTRDACAPCPMPHRASPCRIAHVRAPARERGELGRGAGAWGRGAWAWGVSRKRRAGGTGRGIMCVLIFRDTL